MSRIAAKRSRALIFLGFGGVGGAPQIPGGGGAVGTPALAELEQGLGLGQGSFTVGDAEAVAHAEVVHGQDVGATELENEEHFDGPTAHAADLGQAGDDFVVGQFGDLAAGGDEAGEGFFGEVADGPDFGEGEAAGAELVVGHGGDFLGAGEAARGEELAEAAEDGGGGGAV